MASLPKTPITVPIVAPSPKMERVEAWTASQAADVLTATSISSPAVSRSVRGTSVTLNIPLDDSPAREDAPRKRPGEVHTVYKRSEPVRRDSLKRREALLKGKEGSRARRRWENDRLMHNPHAQPPLPSDWEVHPTHPVQSVPYFLAPLWDAEYARIDEGRKKRAEATKAPKTNDEAVAAKVTQDLRSKLKRARGAKGLLQDLEEEVRGFVEKWEAKQRQLEKEGLIEPDSEDEEIVFVGRNGVMSDEQRRSRQDEVLEKDKLIFQSLVDDHGASFGYDASFKLGALLLLTVALQAISCALDRAVLWPEDLVDNHRQPCATRGVCWVEDRSEDETAEFDESRDAAAVVCCCLSEIHTHLPGSIYVGYYAHYPNTKGANR